MTARRRRGQTSFNDWFTSAGFPRPEELMDPVLKRIDGVLDDEQLVDQVFDALSKRHQESARTGRPSTPAEIVLRMLVLKHLRGWSYEQLEWEVTGNFVYRRFCRIDGGKVPDEKTMVRYGQLVGDAVIKQLFVRVVELASFAMSPGRAGVMRVDTTVVKRQSITRPTAACSPMLRVCSRAKSARLRRLEPSSLCVRTDVRRSLARRLLEESGTHYASAGTTQRQRS